jgi:hypothetical protein
MVFTLEIDPNYISSAIWRDIDVFTNNFRWFVLFIVIFAANMLVTHAAIPSLVKSYSIPQSFNKLRPPLYAIAVLFFAIAIYFVVRSFVGALNAIQAIYPDFWI